MQSDVPCRMCSSKASKYCGTCKAMSYCSKSCEKADRPVHKLLCTPNPHPELWVDGGERACYGILFPENEHAPRFVGFNGRDPGSRFQYMGSYYNHPFQQILDIQSEQTLTITGNSLRSRTRWNDKIELHYNDFSPADRSRNNLSIRTVTGGRTAQPWRGPLLAVKLPVVAPGKGFLYLNMDMIDFRDVVDLLSTFPTMNINEKAIVPALANAEVSAVRINCPGNRALGRAKFEAVRIRADDVTWGAPVTSISQLIGFPLRVVRCAPPHDPAFDDPNHDISNPAAVYLNLGIAPEADWGFVGADWIDPPGSVMVLSGKGVDLSPQHVEALCHWCQFVLKPLFDDSLLIGLHPDNPMKKSEVLARITRREFENFYVGYDEWRGSVDSNWKKSQWPFC